MTEIEVLRLEIGKLALGPDDIIVLRSPHVTDYQRHRVLGMMKQVTDHRCLVLDSTVEISVTDHRCLVLDSTVEISVAGPA